MARCHASLVLLSFFVAFTYQNIFVDFEPSSSCTQVQVTSDHCPYMYESAHAIPSIHMDNTSEPATVLSINQSLVGFGTVDAYAQLCPTIDVCELASTIDSAWATMCDYQCSMHQPLDESNLPSWQEIDMYQFDATHLAWSLGRLGLHS
eukprot:1147284-Amphidinium_carterae.1